MVVSDNLWNAIGGVDMLEGLPGLLDMLSGVVAGDVNEDVVVLINVGLVHSHASPSGTHEPLKRARHWDHH